MRLAWSALLAVTAVATQGAESETAADWQIKSGGHACEIATFAYSASGDNRMLFIQWSPDTGYKMSVWGPATEAMVIESVGTADIFTVSPVDRNRLLAGAAVESLNSNLAHGVRIKLTEKPANHEPEEFVTPATNSQQAVAALEACVEMLQRHPVPKDVSTERGYYLATGTAHRCDVGRYWRTNIAAFTITLVAELNGTAVEFARVLGDHGARPTKPFSVDARNFYGQKLTDMRSVRVELNEQQVAELAAELQAGKSRSFDLIEADSAPETLTFGSPVVRAPAAMFGVCRRGLHAEHAPANIP